MTIHVDLLRSRAEGLTDPEERGRLIKLLDELGAITELLVSCEKAPETWAREGVDEALLSRARWTRDRLEEEVQGRLTKAEGQR